MPLTEKQHFSTDSVACGCCSKTASKKSPPGGKQHASKGRASSKTTAKKCLTCRLKSEENSTFDRFFDRFCCLRLLAIRQQSPPGQGNTMPLTEKQHFSTDSVACGCCSKTASKNHIPVRKNTMPLKDELVPNQRQKSA